MRVDPVVGDDVGEGRRGQDGEADADGVTAPRTVNLGGRSPDVPKDSSLRRETARVPSKEPRPGSEKRAYTMHPAIHRRQLET